MRRAEEGLATGVSRFKKNARRTRPPAFKAQIALTVLRDGQDAGRPDQAVRPAAQPGHRVEAPTAAMDNADRWQSAQSPLESRGMLFRQTGPLLNLGAVPLFQMSLDFPNRHVAGVERQDLDVKAGPAGLVLGDALGSKLPWRSQGDQQQFAESAFEGLFALAVAAVARRVATGSCRAWPRCSAISASRRAPPASW